MFKVGAVDIDTSHPQEFAVKMLQLGRGKYTCVYNAGFRSDNYVEKFMNEKDVPIRCSTLNEMAEQVDVAFIHSCNWDRHLELAEPFIKAAKPVFIDKPIVGNLADCVQIETYVKKGANILGSSALRYCVEFDEFMAKPISERGEIIALFGSVGVDEFNYGIHVVEGFGRFVTNAHSVQCISSGNVEIYRIKYQNGIQAVYQLSTGIWRPAVFVLTTTKGTFTIVPDPQKLYNALLTRIFDGLENNSPLASIDELTDSIKIMLAGKKSRQLHGLEIKLSDLCLNDPGYDGYAFERYYAKLSG